MAFRLEGDHLRKTHWATIAVAAVLLLVGLLVLGGPANAAPRLAVILLLVALLGLQGWLLWQERRAPTLQPELDTWQPPASGVEATPGSVRKALRCKQCGQVFEILDTGERPLATSCPHCGKTGTIKVRGRDAA